MQLERLSVALRPRGGWESLDLGFQLARAWWRPVWGTWLAVYLPHGLTDLGQFGDIKEVYTPSETGSDQFGN